MSNNAQRTKWRGIRQCELDFRVLPREMVRQRILHNRIMKLKEAKRLGQKINESELDLLQVRKKRIDRFIPDRFDQLYARMSRIYKDQRKWADLIGHGGDYGN
jgi:hypothetical protein